MQDPDLSSPSNSDGSLWPSANHRRPHSPSEAKLEMLQQQVSQWEQAETNRKQILELQRETALWQTKAVKRRRLAHILLIILWLVIVIGFFLCVIGFWIAILSFGD